MLKFILFKNNLLSINKQILNPAIHGKNFDSKKHKPNLRMLKNQVGNDASQAGTESTFGKAFDFLNAFEQNCHYIATFDHIPPIVLYPKYRDGDVDNDCFCFNWMVNKRIYCEKLMFIGSIWNPSNGSNMIKLLDGTQLDKLVDHLRECKYVKDLNILSDLLKIVASYVTKSDAYIGFLQKLDKIRDSK